MKYWSGEEIIVGDQIDAFGCEGIVVYVVDSGQLTHNEPNNRTRWKKNMIFCSHARLAKAWFSVLLVGFTTLCAAGQAFNQNRQDEFPTTCEDSIRIVAEAMIKNDKRRDEKASFIVVSRLGVGEKQLLEPKRIKNIKSHLVALKAPFPVLVLRGEKAPGLGRLEFYVDGVLIDELRFVKNQVLDLRTCWIP